MGKAKISNPNPNPNPNPNSNFNSNPNPNPTLTLTLTRQGQDLPQRVQGHGAQGDAPRPRERQPRRHARQCDMVPALVVGGGEEEGVLESQVENAKREASYRPGHKQRHGNAFILIFRPIPGI